MIKLTLKLERIDEALLVETLGAAQIAYGDQRVVEAVHEYNEVATAMLNQTPMSKTARLIESILNVMHEKPRWTIWEIGNLTQSNVYSETVYAMQLLESQGEVVSHEGAALRTYELAR